MLVNSSDYSEQFGSDSYTEEQNERNDSKIENDCCREEDTKEKRELDLIKFRFRGEVVKLEINILWNQSNCEKKSKCLQLMFIQYLSKLKGDFFNY